MKKLVIILTVLTLKASAQNCTLYVTDSCKKACDLYYEATAYTQGGKRSQEIFDSSLALCPQFAESWREKSVPFLKRGDFVTWWNLMEKAVSIEPKAYLGYRGWCCFQFLRDYKTALDDFNQLENLNGDLVEYSVDGEYDLRLARALCRRELGDNKAALLEMDNCISDHEKKNVVGLYDYLHRGVTKLRIKDYQGAIEDFNKEENIYNKLADAQYYLGKAYKALGETEKAKYYFEKAKDLFTKSGYHRYYDYCEPPDIVYLSDIEEELKSY